MPDDPHHKIFGREASMKTLVIQGSPKKDGNTATLTKSFLDGLVSGGNEVEISEFWLNDMDIQPCQGCFLCSGTSRCIYDDDMQRIYPEIESSTLIVFAVPIYWWHMNAQTKLCIDRLTALLSLDDQLPALVGKHIVLVVCYNYRACAECTIKMFEDFKDWINVRLDVLEHCAKEGHVSSAASRLEAAYRLGREIGENESDR
ncbi:MAG: flavodoxin family protein [Anaerolineales bacterium]